MKMLNADGWFLNATHYTILGRPDGNGGKFRPLTEGLNPATKARYGSVRICTLHCTDVICDAGSLARRTAGSSPRKSSYHLLIGMDGDLHQLASIYDRTWHAGRRLRTPKGGGYLDVIDRSRAHGSSLLAQSLGAVALRVANPETQAWRTPVVDGIVVCNPNNWGPGIEIMGKPGRPTSLQLACLTNVLLELYESTKITPDTICAHGDLDPLHRSDPGFDVYSFARAITEQAIEEREQDGWDAAGEDD